ncbi:glycosyltransferase [Enterococcus faecium]|uniref:glycosyltransferase n=1 Tax=Enterococcus faecium TaxID=1352 RepID=UPI00129CB127|nr:glycosyltransferase [Enterococcus faecium]MCD5103790.1 glycosyltransferase [Enterococcus faecium]MDK4377297.1 glycosyltransferase [Enterococcus faecium]MRI45692.1 glycosyltransferase family 4 protein [Enterococcus faecium]NTL97218.1 glycosyltransferase [Enterococcus faecium]HAQ0365806.1 glycosyltransferase family 4 protein [Enterococcus faecium]
MKLGILITSISNFGEKGFYNAQEVGLAKSIAKIVDQVIVYKLVTKEQDERVEKIRFVENAMIHFIPAKNFGINGFVNLKKLDAELDAMIHFSDTQFSVPKVYHWCKKNNIRYIPYIGVIESHSTSGAKKLITNLLFQRNLRIYRKSICFVKTPTVQKALIKMRVKNTIVSPVGLDLDLVHKDYAEQSKKALCEKYGYSEEERVLLFIGRMIDEKRPVEMIEIFATLYAQDKTYRLLMVGTGELKDDVKKAVKRHRLENMVQLIPRISNSDIWELYRMAEVFVNLNKEEIFGMAILEAMYYGCKVVARRAPGPDFIIESGKSGYLASNDKEIVEMILNGVILKREANTRIVECFSWDSMAIEVTEILKLTKD